MITRLLRIAALQALLMGASVAAAARRPYRKVVREQAAQRTRDALLDAADEEFIGGRWAKISLQAVAAKAGVTKQTALRHFGSKEGLLEAAIHRISELVRCERARAPVGDVPGAVSNLIAHYERYGDLVMRVLAEEHRGGLVRRMTDRGREVHYEWVARTFAPQLAGLEEPARGQRTAQLVVICDVYVWKLLRRDMALAVPSAEAALNEMIARLLADES